jgi:hypothetical protein
MLTGLLAAYFVVKEIEGVSAIPMFSYTVAFGVLLVASLLLIIFGFEALDSPLVVILSTLIPLNLSLGLVWEHWVAWRIPYLLFVIAGFLAIAVTRLGRSGASADIGKPAILILTVVHGVAGLIIFILPILLSISGQAKPGFVLVGAGGALIGVGGLFLSFVKIGIPILSWEMILKVFPGLLLLATAAFTAGFAFT